MLAAGFIEISPASYYSQVHIAPKPGGFRFCIDFRKLNDATESASWPKYSTNAYTDWGT